MLFRVGIGARGDLPRGSRLRLLRLLGLQGPLFRARHGALDGVLGAVDRPDMWWVAIAIRAPDPKLLLVRIDPLPQHVARRRSLGTGVALDTDKIGREAVPIAAAPASAMIGAVR